MSNLDTSPARLGAVARTGAWWTGVVAEYWPSRWLCESREDDPDMPCVMIFGVLGLVFDGMRRGAGLSGEFWYSWASGPTRAVAARGRVYGVEEEEDIDVSGTDTLGAMVRAGRGETVCSFDALGCSRTGQMKVVTRVDTRKQKTVCVVLLPGQHDVRCLPISISVLLASGHLCACSFRLCGTSLSPWLRMLDFNLETAALRS
ncbi:hypothetical protein CONLIGDRAFT_409826 [Coniochaeta ligniaria NRRL 30616]|uniref:Uncharacterized protein n=1 Tax=Coniochaeta ligniaria NRRL 30616 TaxID=1408157 RepID=A0A1J7JHG3_9PEZI|nr:hypothetical protein CONLIGDRAFT_409826 [Coniochaeta ligniaria NRRL 30616]